MDWVQGIESSCDPPSSDPPGVQSLLGEEPSSQQTTHRLSGQPGPVSPPSHLIGQTRDLSSEDVNAIIVLTSHLSALSSLQSVSARLGSAASVPGLLAGKGS